MGGIWSVDAFICAGFAVVEMLSDYLIFFCVGLFFCGVVRSQGAVVLFFFAGVRLVLLGAVGGLGDNGVGVRSW